MMMNIAIAAAVILFAAAGYLAFMNSRLIADKKREAYIPPPASEYTVYKTAQFTREDERTLTPIGVMEYEDPQGPMKVYLCRVRHKAEDLKLEEAGDVFLSHLKAARDRGTLRFYRTVEEALQGQDEIRLTERLTAVAKKR